MTAINVHREMLASQQVRASVLRLFAMMTMSAPQIPVFLQRVVSSQITTLLVTMKMLVLRTINAMERVQDSNSPAMMEMSVPMMCV